MNNYFFAFETVGEIADLLLMTKPTKHLLLDISNDPPGHEKTSLRKYPSRTTFRVMDTDLITEILNTAVKGDTVSVKGAFSQSGYVPYRTTSIDTVFEIQEFKLMHKSTMPIAPSKNAIAEHRI
jgi:hypothetical protein